MKTHDDVNRIVELFKQRSAYWTSQAYFGADLYRKLAEDSHLPENFSPKVAAAILGVKPEAMAATAQARCTAQLFPLEPKFSGLPARGVLLVSRGSLR